MKRGYNANNKQRQCRGLVASCCCNRELKTKPRVPLACLSNHLYQACGGQHSCMSPICSNATGKGTKGAGSPAGPKGTSPVQPGRLPSEQPLGPSGSRQLPPRPDRCSAELAPPPRRAGITAMATETSRRQQKAPGCCRQTNGSLK